ncbi:hypothetical protein psyc5s11_19270 [Clostridium gelidum]|uniref:Uncharacterized protein n=1 Tax=Clostridium gelidum TaxID=704125 RepID=A0ABM7TA76_9CLOT|nr:hypothetical protein [Clostridium gelidum]BCZ45860.1 hypothetical protein psyc5s11_19270 [Clostridium gelidum]
MFIRTYYSLKELFDYQKPKMIILTTEQNNFTAKQEKPLVYLSVAPYMKSLFNMAQYYLSSSAQDGLYLDRLFPWRGYDVKSPQEAVKNFDGKLDDYYINYPEPGQVEAFSNNKSGYIGRGAVKVNK